MADFNALSLRDIHLPEGASWWPPAPAWWLLLAGMIIVVTVAGLLWRGYRRRHWQRVALRELRTIWRSYRHHQDGVVLLRALSRFCRRLMVLRYGYSAVTSRSGEAWLQSLDRALGSDDFSQGAGRILAYGPFRTEVSYSAPKLYRLVERLTCKVVGAGVEPKVVTKGRL
ncbi:DUF4381 domain-containing protein [Ectothiorhodospiraceae bacterium BW-2]|nr:DUF4381 domain-containing protein [Ectothiorhodospiraceae bacterium BW-2]